ncbi:tetratricopeptide repeat protein [Marinicella sp. S1101]|uniref:tetratricopeptide repeat protein n=1 Tax=Marinicella marina TaxID=2996016 RepID=UPI00226102B5|nr:tetratricopeptide repeat protein [Marinicella marina]MCX7552279.1 tetratricopeptide repeat protein [Marinicella marina]MDJ1139155.1 tetratricopeptide repeat protein [Marinicella marina]
MSVNFSKMRVLNTGKRMGCWLYVLLWAALFLNTKTVVANIQLSALESCTHTVRSEDFELAAVICQQQLIQAEQANDQQLALHLIIALVDTYRQAEKGDLYQQFLLRAESHPMLPLAPESRYKLLRMKAIELHHQKSFVASEQLFTDALRLAIDMNDSGKISDSNIDLGISASAQENYKKALSHYRTSLDLTREQNDWYAIGLSLKSVANVYVKLEEYDAAIRFLNEALAAYQAYTQTTDFDQRVFNRMHSVYEGLMEVHRMVNDETTATHYQSLMAQNGKNTVNDHDRANALITEAKQHNELERHDLAVEKLLEAKHLYHHSGVEQPLEILQLLAESYAQLKQQQLALSYAHQVEHNLENTPNGSLIISQNQLLLSQLYTDEDVTKALYYTQQYNQSREAFLRNKYNSDLKTIQHQIELEKNHNKLMRSEVENLQQKAQIQTLNNRYLWSLLVLLLLGTWVVYLMIKKRRQQAALTATINYHKNQLAVLSLSSQPAVSDEHSELTQEQINEALVRLMIDATELWLKTTGETLLELADRSKVWTITNDNGTLRTRSLDRYLSMQKMPAKPRWRNVVRTGHFVLAEPALNETERAQLNQKLEALMQMIKDFYGTSVK